jgi:hypothetical protein
MRGHGQGMVAWEPSAQSRRSAAQQPHVGGGDHRRGGAEPRRHRQVGGDAGLDGRDGEAKPAQGQGGGEDAVAHVTAHLRLRSLRGPPVTGDPPAAVRGGPHRAAERQVDGHAEDPPAHVVDVVADQGEAAGGHPEGGRRSRAELLLEDAGGPGPEPVGLRRALAPASRRCRPAVPSRV